MNTILFEQFRDLIYEQSGISLASSKQTLLQSRIGKRMRTLNIGQEQDYLHRIVGDQSGEEIVFLLDAISTNVTYFYREPEHFDRLKTVLQQWLSEGRSRIRLWSAACSSGQEPYTMGMVASEVIRQSGKSGTDLRILATDISTKVLDAAIRGQYTEREIERVSSEDRSRYLRSAGGPQPAAYTVADELRQLITFRRLNLSQPPFPMRGPFDAIFCRNVMIYFDDPVRARLVAEMTRLLRPGGLLFIGHAESLLGITANLAAVAPSVYQKGSQ